MATSAVTPQPTPTVAMIAPNGQSGDIPVDKVQEAQQSGFKPAYDMLAPDGKTEGYVPKDQVYKAQQSGFKITNLTQNPAMEGTYGMVDNKGNKVGIPYSLVDVAHGQGYQFDNSQNNNGLTPAQQFTKDQAADPNRTTGSSLHMAPAGATYSGAFAPVSRQDSIQRENAAEAAAPLPIKLATGVSKGHLSLARPVLDTVALATGQTPDEISQQLAPQSRAEAVAKYGTMGAAVVPAAIAAPVATGLGLAGGAAGGYAGQKAGQAMGLSPQSTQVLGDVGGVVGGAVAPMVGRAVVPLAGRALLLGKTPEAAYESALKPSPSISSADRASFVQTGLQNAIPVSKAGVAKIGDLIDTLNQSIKDTIAADPNRPIDPNAVATRADAAKAKFANQVNAQTDLNAIEASRQQFLAEQGAKPGVPAVPPKPTGTLDAQGRPIMDAGTPAVPPTPAPPMGAAQAQAMKQGTYRVLAGKYGEQGSASVEAQKALARGLKEEISAQFPEINNLNAAESRLLDLQPVLERAVNRISNHQAIGIGTPITGVAAKAVTGSNTIGTVAMMLKGVVDNPLVKSHLAIQISKANNIPIATAMSRVNAYSASLGASAAAASQSSTADSSSQAQNQQTSP